MLLILFDMFLEPPLRSLDEKCVALVYIIETVNWLCIA